MNVLFLSISSLPHLSEHAISLDLIREFVRNGHSVTVVCAIEKNASGETCLAEEAGCKILRVKIGNNKKAGIIEKGITTIFLPHIYKKAIKKYLSGIKFDLVLYPTPPVTQVKTVEYIKKRDNAKAYLLLKDIFPQNAVDIGMMSKGGVKGILYRYFRRQEKRLYAVSDAIGCMSEANVDYVVRHNPSIDPSKVEVCPNSIEFVDMRADAQVKKAVRIKYNLPLDKTIFVYGGNLGKPQGIPFLIDCLKAEKENEKVYFLIVGEGTEYNKIQSYFDTEQPENVRLSERLSKEEYDLLVAACDVGLIFLDHRFTIPNFPSRLLSYMQAGIPVLACTDPNTDIGEVITQGGFGWWCESNNVDFFSSLITAISQNNQLENNAEVEIGYLNKWFSSKRCYEIIMKRVCDRDISYENISC